MGYSAKFMEHFLNPKNSRKPEKYNYSGKAVHEVDSDEVVIYINIKEDTIEEVGYQVKGCPRAIAATSVFSTLIKGKNVKDALKISENDIRRELELYDEKYTCISIPVKAFKNALEALK
ncbi:MAG: nitrogen fixation protein NifU [Thermotogaceae bacterium]|jgi:nitrogen fixation NifU-like protein|nr:nitrogen fixation protein NifU [Thermotogaceae bacterium]MDN5338076.1 nitrogen fixation protein NifU [Thermotogaceae bacterium]